MPAEENKAIVRRFYEEFFNDGNPAAADQLLAPSYVAHLPGQELRGPEAQKQFHSMYRAAFPDGRVVIDDLIAEGDKVVVRFTARFTHRGEFMGLPPTGKEVMVTGIDIYRVAGSQIAELWEQIDALGMMQQLGAIPVPGHSEEASPA